MSLVIYDRESLPHDLYVERFNDLVFEGIPNTPMAKRVIKEIDQAKYVSKDIFIGRQPELGGLNCACLSTGAKTLLNILSYPDKCYSVEECGDNALRLLLHFREGTVFWDYPSIGFDEEDSSCSIIYRGKLFTDIYKFLGEAMG